ncbi:hemolysin secretion protein D [bacteria symbiont BFo1 of Frankliniella occidentalis]|uniref:HlyD family type I secretion periplasmic adaptor subunit n=1 Tax=Erwinia aphidicola TaxID=68334 RepID=UPI0006646677|nr:hemolysin secretion protein D [bacteria symbiont BFo1 of Frankliniella occidentalis]KYP83405.1 hemolysin secretion protein D [bacteria symbiont BFo1 of Frankliniella occidentalis]KYP88613.1 hemolysin secretion protein D [bacteria symbiont BFo1 of Frankliniella occidentalis]
MAKFSLRRKKALSAGDSAFMNDIQSSLLSQKTPGSHLVLIIFMAVIVCFLTWAHFARVEEITKGEAKIVSRSHEQVIQSLEGGILATMEVHEGQEVKRGEVLLKIDPTRAQASYRETLNKVLGLKATIARLRAEAYGQPLVFDDQVKSDPAVVEQETKAYNARKQALHDAVGALQRSYELSMREIQMSQPLANRGLLSEVEMLRMQRQANDLQSQIVERRNRYQAEANADLNKLELELSQTSENLIGRADIMERTTIAAPVNGTVKNIRVNTIGGVIQPGEHIMEIVPSEDQLLVEAKIRPSDVAFLHPGLPATVKITAYDYGIYGGLKGQVELISPDTIKDDAKTAAGRPDDTYYRVLVLTDSSTLDVGDKHLPIIPGMIASVEVRTGEKTILEYLLKPVFKAREAFRER